MQLIVAFNEQHIFKYVLSPGTQVIHKSSDSLNRKRAYTERKALTLKLQTCCRDSRHSGLPERHFPTEGVSVGSTETELRLRSHWYFGMSTETPTHFSSNPDKGRFIPTLLVLY